MHHHSNFSIHARERVEERLSMSEEEVGDLLDYDLAVKIAEEKDTNRVHLLFYSPDDFQCFVAVQDHRTKTVVTLLPVDFYERLNHKIAPAFIVEAKLKLSPDYDPAGAGQPPESSKTSEGALVFRISAVFSLSGGGFKVRKIGVWNRRQNETPDDLLRSKTFVAAIVKKISVAAPDDARPLSITIRRGNKGAAVTCPVEALTGSL